jgi:hypothetical protein
MQAWCSAAYRLGRTGHGRYLRSLYPAEVRIAIICDNFSPHLVAPAQLPKFR